MTWATRGTIERFDEISRERVLTSAETRLVAYAVYEKRKHPHRPWSWREDEQKLLDMLANGKRPRQIAIALKRTPRAIYRKMYKLGLKCGDYE